MNLQPAIILKQKRDWEQIRDEIAHLAVQDDQNAMTMGDLFVEIEETFKKDHIKTAASQAGVSLSVARQRFWVSKRIPKGHPIRYKFLQPTMLLTFSHLRAIAGTDPDTMESWAQQAVDHQWSVAELKEAIEKAGDQKAVEEGGVCIQCEEPLMKSNITVSFSITGKKRARCCSYECARDYFEEMIAEEGGQSFSLE
jgi:hypothetical protein